MKSSSPGGLQVELQSQCGDLLLCLPTHHPQVFVFRDYLRHIVGDDAMRRYLGRYRRYNPDVDPSIANVFATAAYRFAHLAIQPTLSRLDVTFRENRQFPSVPLFKAFFTPWRIIFEGGLQRRSTATCVSSSNKRVIKKHEK